MNSSAAQLESRVLVLAPTGRDAAVALRLLRDDGAQADVAGTMPELLTEIRRGAGVVIVTDHPAQSASDSVALREQLVIQPQWSELPVLVLSRSESGSDRLPHLRALPGVVLLERPVNVRTLLSAVRAGLRARGRQYELREQLEQIRLANRELWDSGQAKDAFLATLAHELRNPLSAMTSASRILNTDADGSGRRRMAQQVITRQIAQMTRLLDDLLDIARITRSRLELRKEPSSIASIVDAAVETALHIVQAKHHQLNVRISPQDIALKVDPLRISQVISNLLTNAAKYTPSGGRIDLLAQREGDTLLIEVSDTGMGIPSEALDRIFGMFAQLRPALERSEGGLGIGLALARGLLELHGGTITARSAGVGKGSTFTIRLPIETGLPCTNCGTTRMPRTPHALRHVLLADDNADSLQALASLLRMEGHAVSVATDGLEVLQLLAVESPQVLLLDIGMPGLNGYEVARRVRAEFPGRSMLLIALSGWGQVDDKRRAHEAGFDHHMTKPVDLDRLATLLEQDAP